MENYKDMDYALNKNSKGIVYKFVDGIIETTLADYLYENPEKTEKDFANLKALSDEIYYEQDRRQNRTTYRDISIHCLKYTEKILFNLINNDEEQENQRKTDKERALKAARKLIYSGNLTKIQKRRFLLYFFKGLSIRQIARKEGVHQRAVWDSLYWARKKLRKIFEKLMRE